MPIILTETQQKEFDAAGDAPRLVDPRTNAEYFLVPAAKFESVREILADEERQLAICRASARTMGRRMREEP